MNVLIEKAELNPTLTIGEISEALLSGIKNLGNDFIHTGDALSVASSTSVSDSPEEVNALFYHFQFSERAKQLLLLWRNVLFQHLKGKVLLADGKNTETGLLEHWAQSVITIQEATSELKIWADQQLDALYHSPPGKKQLKQWRLQNNPWEIYRGQLQTIVDQAVFLEKNNQEALGHALVFREIKAAVSDNGRQYLKEVAEFENGVAEILELLENNGEANAGTIVRKLAKTEELVLLADHAGVFKTKLETLSEALPTKWQSVVVANGGLLLRSEMDLKRKAGQWLESEAMPLLYEIRELAAETQNGFKMVLSNVQNRLQLLPKGEPIDTAEYTQPFLAHRDRLKSIGNEMQVLVNTLQERLDKNFNLSNSYDSQHPFLPVSMQLSVGQLDRTRGRILGQFGALALQAKAWFDRIIRQVEQEESLGFAEKTVRYLEHRKPQPEATAYTSIFLTKGFVGSSFATGRAAEMTHLSQLFRHWEQGYRGAALLTGRRLCGKTFVGEWAASSHFPGNTIRITAGQEVVIDGRKLPATTDLAAALDFVKKHALLNRPLLWLDDLELWQDAHHNFFDNMEALVGFIDRYATRCFVLAATNHLAFRHIQSLLGMDKAFQTTIHLNTMQQDDIAHALLIRHGATHKKLVSKENGEPIAVSAFRSLANKVGRAAHGNIGEALQWWTSSVRMNEDDTVFLDFNDKYSLPQNPDADTNLLLGEIIWQKRTDEYRLRRQFGPAFGDHYVHLLRRLLGMGVVRRRAGGGLEVEEAAVNGLAF